MTKVNLDKIQAKGDGNIASVVGEVVLQNGALVALGEMYAEGAFVNEREIFQAVAPTAELELLLVAAPEVKYDESLDQLDYETPADTPVRAYHLKRGDLFQVEQALATGGAKGDILTGGADYGYVVAEGTEKTTFKVEAETVFGFDKRKMFLLRVL